jgi:hypothetical protein
MVLVYDLRRDRRYREEILWRMDEQWQAYLRGGYMNENTRKAIHRIAELIRNGSDTNDNIVDELVTIRDNEQQTLDGLAGSNLEMSSRAKDYEQAVTALGAAIAALESDDKASAIQHLEQI